MRTLNQRLFKYWAVTLSISFLSPLLAVGKMTAIELKEEKENLRALRKDLSIRWMKDKNKPSKEKEGMLKKVYNKIPSMSPGLAGVGAAVLSTSVSNISTTSAAAVGLIGAALKKGYDTYKPVSDTINPEDRLEELQFQSKEINENIQRACPVVGSLSQCGDEEIFKLTHELLSDLMLRINTFKTELAKESVESNHSEVCQIPQDKESVDELNVIIKKERKLVKEKLIADAAAAKAAAPSVDEINKAQKVVEKKAKIEFYELKCQEQEEAYNASRRSSSSKRRSLLEAEKANPTIKQLSILENTFKKHFNPYFSKPTNNVVATNKNKLLKGNIAQFTDEISTLLSGMEYNKTNDRIEGDDTEEAWSFTPSTDLPTTQVDADRRVELEETKETIQAYKATLSDPSKCNSVSGLKSLERTIDELRKIANKNPRLVDSEELLEKEEQIFIAKIDLLMRQASNASGAQLLRLIEDILNITSLHTGESASAVQSRVAEFILSAARKAKDNGEYEDSKKLIQKARAAGIASNQRNEIRDLEASIKNAPQVEASINLINNAIVKQQNGMGMNTQEQSAIMDLVNGNSTLMKSACTKSEDSLNCQALKAAKDRLFPQAPANHANAQMNPMNQGMQNPMVHAMQNQMQNQMMLGMQNPMMNPYMQQQAMMMPYGMNPMGF